MLFTVLLLASCTVPQQDKRILQDGEDGFTSLIDVTNISSGTICETGGIRIVTGLDLDRNQILTDDEINTVNFVCNGLQGETGENGTNSLVETEPLEAGGECPTGGTLISVGLDLNGSGTLESNEITYTTVVCNGEDGQDGQDGQDGEDGEDGQDGTDGNDGQDGQAGDNGHSTLVVTSPDSEVCPDGGIKIEIGLDLNDNLILDVDEITSTEYVCDGEDGDSSLIRTSNESAGDNCPNGGIKLETGIDSNGNGVLDNSEVVTTDYICDGENGFTTLFTSTEVEEGTLISYGLDLNNDGILQDSEITNTFLVINGLDGTDGTDGTDGLNSLIRVFEIEPNDEFPNGGLEIWTGLDTNGDGVLTLDEATSISYVANGLDGNDGVNGYNSLINTITQEDGTLVQVGLDTNNDGILQESEITNEFFIENGTDGNDGTDGQDGEDGLCALVVVTEELPGDNCEFGGIKVQAGKDLNSNGVLDADEVMYTEYICNPGGCVETTNNVLIDFEDLNEGQFVSHLEPSDGCNGIICVYGYNPFFDHNKAMIFDSNDPTGGDSDLGVNQGNILIVSEDGDGNDPDDLADPRGYLFFDFRGYNTQNTSSDGVVTVNSIDLIHMDSNSSAKIVLKDTNNNQIGSDIDIPATSNGGVVTMNLNIEGVAKMYVFLGGSGAVDNLDITCVTNSCE